MEHINVKNLRLQFDDSAYEGTPLLQARKMIQSINEALAGVPDACPQLSSEISPADVELEDEETVQEFPEGARGTAGALWNRFGSKAGRSEGWDLFTRGNGELEIEVIADPSGVPELQSQGVVEPLFSGDDQAVRHCLAKSRDGSPVHLLALYLEGRVHDRECWVPTELCPKDCRILADLTRGNDQDSTPICQIRVELTRASLPFVLTPDGLLRLTNPEAWCPGRMHLVEYHPFDQFATIVAVAIS